MRACAWIALPAALAALGAACPVRAQQREATPVQAEELPCSAPNPTVSYTIRWQPQGTADDTVDGWVLVRQAFGLPPEALTLEPGTPDGTGVLSAAVDGFTTHDRWRITVHAVNVGGWSEPSNVLEIPARTRRCGPPVAPKLWELQAEKRLPEPPPPQRSLGRRLIEVLPGVKP